MKEHRYALSAIWTGNTGTGTSGLRQYERSHTISNDGKPDLFLTTDNASVGDKSKLNPEDLLVSALVSCHMLSYLYVCALEGIVVIEYSDKALGIMLENEQGSGAFKEVSLHPEMVVSDPAMIEKALALHHKAHEICYIANSVNFPVHCFPVCRSL